MGLLLQYKAYIGAAGLAGLALYQFSQGNYEMALGTFSAALVGLGLRHETAPASVAGSVAHSEAVRVEHLENHYL